MTTPNSAENQQTEQTTQPTEQTTQQTEQSSLVNQQQQPEQKAEQKTEAAPEFVPLKVEDLTFPEGVEVNEAARDDFLGILNNRELSPAEQANKLVELQARLAREASETGSQAWTDLQTQWQDEVRNDPDLGGTKLETTLTEIGKLVEQHGSPEFRKVMDETGAGNSIHVVRFLNSIAKQLTEGTHVSGTQPTTERSAAEQLFPSMAKRS